MRQGDGPRAANLLTGLRVVLSPVFVGTVCLADRGVLWRLAAVAVFAVIAASDVLDGEAARRCGGESPGGRRFDHFADIAFLLAALATYGWLGLVPWWVPTAIGLAFAAYVADSSLSAPVGAPTLVGSRIGHLGGICNYVLVGVLVCNNTARIGLLSPGVLQGLYWLVVGYSTAAVLGRLVHWVRAGMRPLSLVR